MPFTHVKLVYFKKSGKYYSEGELDLPYQSFHQVLEQLQNMLNSGKRPGLVDGMDFDVHATVFTEWGPLPYLFVRDVDGYVGTRSLRTKEP